MSPEGLARPVLPVEMPVAAVARWVWRGVEKVLEEPPPETDSPLSVDARSTPSAVWSSEGREAKSAARDLAVLSAVCFWEACISRLRTALTSVATADSTDALTCPSATTRRAGDCFLAASLAADTQLAETSLQISAKAAAEAVLLFSGRFSTTVGGGQIERTTMPTPSSCTVRFCDVRSSTQANWAYAQNSM